MHWCQLKAESCLDMGVVRAVGITPANLPESVVSEAIAKDLESQDVELQELHIDRAYLNSQMVKQRPEGLTIICKAWSVRNGKRFDKRAFVLDWESHLKSCQERSEHPFL
jgi:hypothetical protein